MFSPSSERTQTVAAISQCRLLAMTRDEMVALYRRHPEFSLYLLRLVTTRLLQNNLRSVREAPAALGRGTEGLFRP
jgi:CRP-like cAMP-binding protein